MTLDAAHSVHELTLASLTVEHVMGVRARFAQLEQILHQVGR